MGSPVNNGLNTRLIVVKPSWNFALLVQASFFPIKKSVALGKDEDGNSSRRTPTVIGSVTISMISPVIVGVGVVLVEVEDLDMVVVVEYVYREVVVVVADGIVLLEDDLEVLDVVVVAYAASTEAFRAAMKAKIWRTKT